MHCPEKCLRVAAGCWRLLLAASDAGRKLADLGRVLTPAKDRVEA